VAALPLAIASAMGAAAMHKRTSLFRVSLLALSVLLTTAAHVQPAVQPGGDIPPAGRLPFPSRVIVPNPDLATFAYERREVFIPMRDGARLYAVLILPRETPTGGGKYPIMLDRTPYSADKRTSLGPAGPQPETILSPLDAELVRAGYIVAIEDVRGKYRSEGDYVMNRPLRGPLNPTAVDHSTDAWDTIDWLVRNVPESNGRVGTFGTSYDGFTALMSLVDPHPALKASVPINPMVDGWKGDDWFHNGAFRQEMIGYVYGQTSGRTSASEYFPSVVDDYSAALRLGSASAYGHAMGLDRLPFWRRLTQHPAYDAYWQGQALDRILARRPLTVPTLIVGSEWDQEDIYGAPALFDAVKASPNARFVLGPWYHGQSNYPALTLGPLSWGVDTARWFRQRLLIPFLDQHLKGGPAADIARVTAFEAGTNRWRRLDDWPLACSRACAAPLVPLYLAPDRQLRFAASANASLAYISDPARPVPYRAPPITAPFAPQSTWQTWLTDDQRFAERRSDVLTFSTAPLEKPLRLAGTPLAHLVASTSGSDSDWVVKLIDVYPAGSRLPGYELPIAMEIFRSRYRGDPAHPAPLPADQPLTYEFALPTVDYVIEPGHRLMVQVQSSWFPLYDRNPQSFVANIFDARPQDYRAATQRVFTGADGSWIGLPVVD
jgi:putative CocE/NonD family hydrolase